MANPNIVSVTSIYGNTTYLSDITGPSTGGNTNGASLLATSADKIRKVNSLMVANKHVSAVSVSVWVYSSSTSFYIAHTISVPADSTLVVISKDSSVYVGENDLLRIAAGTASQLDAVMSYEEIDDA